jgi:hypothetical protein
MRECQLAGGHAERIDYRLQGVHGDIDAPTFEQAHVRAMKRAEISERLLGDPTVGPEFADAGADPLLKITRFISFHLNQSGQV